MHITIEDFLRWRYEDGINEKMLSITYRFPREDVLGYLDQVLAISIEEEISSIRGDSDLGIVTGDIFQFSSIPDVTWRLCVKLDMAGDPVVNAPELGRILLGESGSRNEVAYRKYGENHGKMAAQLGLVQLIEKRFLLSCIGKVYMALECRDRERLLVRLLLRTPFISHLLRSDDSVLEMRQIMSELADTTYLRRRSSTRNMLAILSRSEEFDFEPFMSRIHFG